jgi:hypothetical protein
MHRLIVAFAALAALAAGSAFSPSAAIWGYKDYPRVEPESCSVLSSQIGRRNVWHAWFHGSQQIDQDQHRDFSAAPCFRTHADCFAWMYWAQSDYPLNQLKRFCSKGL